MLILQARIVQQRQLQPKEYKVRENACFLGTVYASIISHIQSTFSSKIPHIMPEFDRLYLDMNGIIHCSSRNNSEEELEKQQQQAENKPGNENNGNGGGVAAATSASPPITPTSLMQAQSIDIKGWCLFSVFKMSFSKNLKRHTYFASHELRGVAFVG